MALSDGDRAKIIQQGLESGFWQAWLLPAIQERARVVLAGLASKKADDDDIKRGIYQGLLWVISLPQQELETIRRTELDAAQRSNDEAEDELRAVYGRNSPFKSVPVGELKEEEEAPANPAA